MPYTKGVHDLNNGLYAYLQPDGSWGWSNAGLICDGGEALLVDTLFDERLTAEMLTQLQDATGIAPAAISTLVNTHANGDHTHGNGLLPHATILASEASAQEMAEISPALLAQFKTAGAAGQLGEAGKYFADIFAPFDFAGVRGRAPTHTFTGTFNVQVGDLAVTLTEVGPAHTAGDVIVHVPALKTVFTGDILFIDSTPLMWAGPVQNWIAACQHIIDSDVEIIVPGHGPVTDRAGVRRVMEYLGYIDSEARKRFDAGLSVEEAALDIALGDFACWGDAERIVVNVDTLYRGYAGDAAPANVLGLFGLMAKIHKEKMPVTGKSETTA
jgi:glyoxylase-like metal-dependent hydrolase (beta-lactamase superfamily II)